MDVVIHVYQGKGGVWMHVCVCVTVTLCIGVCVCVCVSVCHCLAVELMFFMSPSAQVINQGTELRASCLIRLG